MDTDVKTWMDSEGIAFFRAIGVTTGQIVLDIGCGRGHYTIPAAKTVGKTGHVYALDKQQAPFAALREAAGRYALANIDCLIGGNRIPLASETVDFVLCYDVLHYEEREGRRRIYAEALRVLKFRGVFSVYPKHHRNDWPRNQLAPLGLDEIIEEIEASGFRLKLKILRNLLHDDEINEGYLLNFERR